MLLFVYLFGLSCLVRDLERVHNINFGCIVCIIAITWLTTRIPLRSLQRVLPDSQYLQDSCDLKTVVVVPVHGY